MDEFASPWCKLTNAEVLKDLLFEERVTLVGRNDPNEITNEMVPWEMLEFKKKPNELEGQALQKHYGDHLPQELYDALDLLSCGMTKREVRQLVKKVHKKSVK